MMNKTFSCITNYIILKIKEVQYLKYLKTNFRIFFLFY